MKIRKFLLLMMLFYASASYSQLSITDYKQIYNRVDNLLNSYVANSSFSEPKGYKWSSEQENAFKKLFINEEALIYDDINASYLSEVKPYELSDASLASYLPALKQSFPNGIRVTVTNIRVQYDQLSAIKKIPKKNTEFSLDVIVSRKVEGTNLSGATFVNEDTLRMTIGIVLDPANLLLEDQTLIKSISKIGESFKVLNDEDQDGVADGEDACPHQKGAKASKGCPDDDGDGITNQKDHCPHTRGSKANNGCPINYYSKALELSAVAGLTFNNMHIANEVADLKNDYIPWEAGSEEGKGYNTNLSQKADQSGFKASFFTAGADLNYFFKLSKKTIIGKKELSRSVGFGVGLRYTRFQNDFKLDDADDLTVAYLDDAAAIGSQNYNGEVFIEKVARFQRIQSVEEIMKFSDITIDIHLAIRKKLLDGKFGFAFTLGPVISLLSGESVCTGKADYGEVWQHDKTLDTWDAENSKDNWVEITRENYNINGYNEEELVVYFESLYNNKIADVGLNTPIDRTVTLKSQTGFGANGSVALSYFIGPASTIGINLLFNYVSYNQTVDGYKIIDKRSVGYNSVFNGSEKINNTRIGANLTYSINF